MGGGFLVHKIEKIPLDHTQNFLHFLPLKTEFKKERKKRKINQKQEGRTCGVVGFLARTTSKGWKKKKFWYPFKLGSRLWGRKKKKKK